MRPFFRAGVFLATMLFAFGLTAICFDTARAESRYDRKSREHKEACELWCKANPTKCQFCSTKSGCGKNATKMMSFGGYGKNWYACKKTESRKEAGARHKAACNKWCEKSEECVYCSRLIGCRDSKHHKIKSWTGKGTNYYACAKDLSRDEASKRNKAACTKWCEENQPECKFCSRLIGCRDKQHHKIKSWTGKGTNYYACGKKLSRKELGQAHREACEKWCKENPDQCSHCRSTPTCGSKWKKVMTFGGKGKNWYACKPNK